MTFSSTGLDTPRDVIICKENPPNHAKTESMKKKLLMNIIHVIICKENPPNHAKTESMKKTLNEYFSCYKVC